MPRTAAPTIMKGALTPNTFSLVVDVLPFYALNPAAFGKVKIIARTARIVHVEDAT
jgi:hypothetical protein